MSNQTTLAVFVERMTKKAQKIGFTLGNLTGTFGRTKDGLVPLSKDISINSFVNKVYIHGEKRFEQIFCNTPKSLLYSYSFFSIFGSEGKLKFIFDDRIFIGVQPCGKLGKDVLFKPTLKTEKKDAILAAGQLATALGEKVTLLVEGKKEVISPKTNLFGMAKSCRRIVDEVTGYKNIQIAA